MTAVAPGVEIVDRAELTPSGDSGDTGRLFAAGITARGRADRAVSAPGMASYEQAFGQRTSFHALHTAAKGFFVHGGAELVVSRVVGPAAANASVTILDAGGTIDVLTVSARDVGPHGNDISVELVDNGDGTFDVTVTGDDGRTEAYRNLADTPEIVDALSGSDYVRGTDEGATEDPAAGTYNLTGGDDDRANITATEWQAALDRFDADLGPGQVAAPDRDDLHDALISHAEDRNRIALLDVDRDAAAADLTTAGELSSDRAVVVGFGGRMRSDGRLRFVPGSALVAGRIAARDAGQETAHQAAAGYPHGVLSIAELNQPELTETQRGELHQDGVMLAAQRRQGIAIWGWRTLDDSQGYGQLSAARYRMSLVHRAERVAERYLFRTLVNETISDFGNDLSALMLGDFEAGALYGDSPDDAYHVSVGDDVNTDQTIADGELRAAVSAKVAPHAEWVRIEIVRSAIA